MSEFIRKGALLKEVSASKFSEDAKKMQINDCEMDGFFQGYIEGMLMFMPTITEQEIRAKVIEEFAEKIIEKATESSVRCAFSGGIANDVVMLDLMPDMVCKIAEEMRGAE